MGQRPNPMYEKPASGSLCAQPRDTPPGGGGDSLALAQSQPYPGEVHEKSSLIIPRGKLRFSVHRFSRCTGYS